MSDVENFGPLTPDQKTTNLLAMFPYVIVMGFILLFFIFLFFSFYFVNLEESVVAGLVGSTISVLSSVLTIMIGYHFGKREVMDKEKEIEQLRMELERYEVK